MYFHFIIITVIAWLIGLVLDGNIGHGETLGFLMLRVLFPLLAAGLFLLIQGKKADRK